MTQSFALTPFLHEKVAPFVSLDRIAGARTVGWRGAKLIDKKAAALDDV